MSSTRASLRPEFLNRVDEIICFNQLSEAHFRDIAAILLNELKAALDERGLALGWDDTVLDALTQKSYSVQYGARNLRRTIEKEIENPIAEAVIDSFQNPIRILHLSAEDGQIKLEAR